MGFDLSRVSPAIGSREGQQAFIPIYRRPGRIGGAADHARSNGKAL